MSDYLITFDRYFIMLNKPAHHKRGMKAYLKSIKGKRTKEEWDNLFKGY
jgi:hypothetical protein